MHFSALAVSTPYLSAAKLFRARLQKPPDFQKILGTIASTGGIVEAARLSKFS